MVIQNNCYCINGKVALDNFEKYDVDNIIELITGDAVEILPTLGTAHDLRFFRLIRFIPMFSIVV